MVGSTINHLLHLTNARLISIQWYSFPYSLRGMPILGYFRPLSHNGSLTSVPLIEVQCPLPNLANFLIQNLTDTHESDAALSRKSILLSGTIQVSFHLAFCGYSLETSYEYDLNSPFFFN